MEGHCSRAGELGGQEGLCNSLSSGVGLLTWENGGPNSNPHDSPTCLSAALSIPRVLGFHTGRVPWLDASKLSSTPLNPCTCLLGPSGASHFHQAVPTYLASEALPLPRNHPARRPGHRLGTTEGKRERRATYSCEE
ncbi:hypothetical protein H1C71_035082 [Ictidomys tridecemlineatus]|nr:hypothetical protein H1C71_035082 [Ictidomys tridecemlineatus]